MKNRIIIGLILLTTASSCMAQKNDAEEIKNTIQAFSKAGDSQNSDELERLLDSNYRIVMNQLFGSTTVDVMPRAVYLAKISSKEFGGDKRAITIDNLVVNGNTASAKVTFKGVKMTFVSLITLVKNVDDEWLILSDVPVVM